MVCNWGMSDKLGPLKFGNEHEEIFLGKEFGHAKNYSEETARTVDEEIRSIVMSCYEKTKEKLIKNKDLLIKMSDILMKKETLNGEEVDRIMKGENILEKTNEN